MKIYEKPVAELIDFNVEEVMSGSGNAGSNVGSMDEGVGDLPPTP